MNVAGIDCGAKNVKALVLEDDKIKAKSSVLSGFDQKAAAQEALDKALEQAGLKKDDLAYITATGTGKEEVTFAKSAIT